MIPGAFAARAVLEMFSVTAQHSTSLNETLIAAIDDTLRVTLTMGALGIGVAIPSLLLRQGR